MPAIFLIHTQADEQAAARLRHLLAALGYTLADGPPTDDATRLALLTPAALADPAVQQQIQTPPAPLPLLVRDPASFPTAAELAGVIRQLSGAGSGTGSGSKYVVGANIGGAVGDNPLVVNATAAGNLSPAAVAHLVTALRRRGSAAISAEELRAALDRIAGRVEQVGVQVQQLHAVLLARFDRHEQRILAPLLARLDAQESRTLDAILEAIEVSAVAADELDRHLAAIAAALSEVQQRAAQVEDRQLVAGAQQVAELVAAPELDVKHKLKLIVPIIPLLLGYEGEFELHSGFNLEETWRALQRLILRGRNPGGDSR